MSQICVYLVRKIVLHVQTQVFAILVVQDIIFNHKPWVNAYLVKRIVKLVLIIIYAQHVILDTN